MHEFGIAQNIIDIVLDKLKEENVSKKVERVSFRYGQLNQIIPETLRFNFDMLKEENSLLKSARLEIEVEPIHVECSGCGKSFVLTEPNFLCEICKTPLSVISGDEMRVDSIDVED